VATIFWVCVIHAALSLLNVLLLKRPFSVGDINWRAVRLLTLEQEMEQEMVMIRHKLISGSMLRNFTQPNRIHAERKGDPLGTNLPSVLHHHRRSALMSSRDLGGHQRQILSLRNGEFFGEMPSFAQEIGQIREIRRAAIQECSQPPAP